MEHFDKGTAIALGAVCLVCILLFWLFGDDDGSDA